MILSLSAFNAGATITGDKLLQALRTLPPAPRELTGQVRCGVVPDLTIFRLNVDTRRRLGQSEGKRAHDRLRPDFRTTMGGDSLCDAISEWYNVLMTPKPLTPDLAEALQAAGDEPLPVVDPSNQHVYVVVDLAIHERAMKALRHQQNIESIRRGAESMESGDGMTLEESKQRTEEAIRQHARK